MDGCDRPPSRLALLSVGRGTRCPPLGEGGEYLTRENPLHQPACPPPPHLNLSPPGRARRRRPPPPGSQLPPSLLPPEHDGGPFEFFFSVSCSVPLQHLSSIATGSADPSGLRLAPSLGGGKQALPYFAALDCVSTCCFSALLLCQQFSPNPSLWVGYSNTTLLRFVLPRLFFYYCGWMFY